MLKKFFPLFVGLAFIMANLIGSSYAYNLRLMAMGDAEGLVNEGMDYSNYIEQINGVKKANVSISHLDNFFSYSFPQNNQPSSFIYDLEKKGVRQGYELNFAQPFSNGLNLGLLYFNEARDYRSSYINSSGNFQMLNRNGRAEAKTIILGYKLTDWFDLAVAYDDTAQFDSYGGTEISREGVVKQESSVYRGLSYGLRLHNENYWLNLSLSEYQKSTIPADVGGLLGSYNRNAPGRMSLMLGSRMLDGKLIVNYGAYSKRIGMVSDLDGGLGVQVIPYEDVILMFGAKLKQAIDQQGSYLFLSYNLGCEFPLNEVCVLRGGLISKENKIANDYLFSIVEENLLDFTLGLGYVWDRLKFDVLYYNYQGLLGGSYKWMTTSTLLSNSYVYTPTDQRNYLYMISIGYEI